MKTVYLKDVCGVQVLSRASLRKIYDLIDNETDLIDMSEVRFVSRSAADELCEISTRYPDIELAGVEDNVRIMLEIVRKGRSTKRNYVSKAKVSVTYNCRTMEDLRKAIFSFGV